MVNKYTLNDRKMIVKRSRKENKRRLEMNLFRMFMGNLSISNVITIFIRKTCGYAKDVRFFERLKNAEGISLNGEMMIFHGRNGIMVTNSPCTLTEVKRKPECTGCLRRK